MGGRCGWRRCQSRFPTRNDFPFRRAEYVICQVFHRQQLSCTRFTRTGKYLNVTFEPRCRNNWHIHKATKGGGQMLIGVAGRGWYQEEGKPAVEILPGTIIHIPANVKHWHGLPPTDGSPTWLLRFPVRMHPMNGSSR